MRQIECGTTSVDPREVGRDMGRLYMVFERRRRRRAVLGDGVVETARKAMGRMGISEREIEFVDVEQVFGSAELYIYDEVKRTKYFNEGDFLLVGRHRLHVYYDDCSGTVVDVGIVFHERRRISQRTIKARSTMIKWC